MEEDTSAYANGELVSGTLSSVSEVSYIASSIELNNGLVTTNAENIDKKILSEGANIEMNIPSSYFGNAKKEDVASGVTFTSENGISEIGTHICSAGIDLSGVTATAENVLVNKKFVDSTGTEIIGTMPDNGTTLSKTITSNGNISIPKGYHEEGTMIINVSSSISSGDLSYPSVSISPTGLITATSGISTAGYLSTSATKTSTYQMSEATINFVTPTDGRIGWEAVSAGYQAAGNSGYINANVLDSNFIASNIKSGVSICGIQGTYEGGGATYNHVQKTISGSRVQSISISGCSGITADNIVSINLQYNQVITSSGWSAQDILSWCYNKDLSYNKEITWMTSTRYGLLNSSIEFYKADTSTLILATPNSYFNGSYYVLITYTT